MQYGFFITVFLWSWTIINAQKEPVPNAVFLKSLSGDSAYQNKRENVISQFAGESPGKWGEFIHGAGTRLVTSGNNIALTFDACGGKHGSGFDKELIEFLRKNKIQATLFITGRWIDSNPLIFKQLSADSLFEIENHGLNHRPCAMCGESVYGIKGTANIGEAYDEMEANAIKIQQLTGRRPLFYRSATAYTDEACIKLAGILKLQIASYSVLSGDAVPFTPAQEIAQNVIKHIKPGAIVIMHFNHPDWYTFEALKIIIPQLQKLGYSFSKLESYPVTGN